MEARHINLNECDNIEAREKGCYWRCWLNAADMGGWTEKDTLNEFVQAVVNELEKVCSEEEVLDSIYKCDFIELK